MPAGFISEMSAKPVHGGGVTLARILGDDLKRFDWFAKTVNYPHQDTPHYPPARSYHFPIGKLERALRPIIGCSRAHSIAAHPMSRRRFAKQVAKQLLQHESTLAESRILACPQADISLIVLDEIQKRIPLSYVSWMMDDHLLSWENDTWRYPKGFEDLMHRHLTGAQHVFTISPAMQEFYLERFGVNSSVLCGSAEEPRENALSSTANTPIRLVYFGSLGRWQNDALALLAGELTKGTISLDIFTHAPEALPSVLLKAGATLKNGIPSDTVLETAALYDSIVLPISFLPELRNMSVFNIATKFSECLAAPVPTLIIGPPEACMIRIASEADGCLTITEQSEGAVSSAIQRLADTAEREGALKAERALLNQQFTPSVMAARWAPAAQFLFDE